MQVLKVSERLLQYTLQAVELTSRTYSEDKTWESDRPHTVDIDNYLWSSLPHEDTQSKHIALWGFEAHYPLLSMEAQPCASYDFRTYTSAICAHPLIVFLINQHMEHCVWCHKRFLGLLRGECHKDKKQADPCNGTCNA